ncbi:MAG: tyrosine-type recombinase/integrase [Rhodocyclaceae bacterium]|nr:tyrosine-type recombinase/integrase [Rhodocyclaceae bacterium]
MPLHITEYEGKPAFLFLDEEERVIELPTEYLRSLVNSPKKSAPGTILRYAEKARDLCSFLENHEVYGQLRVDDALRTLKVPAVSSFYQTLQGAGLEPTTVRLAESAVRRFTNWLNSDEAKYAHKRPLYPENAPYRTPTPTKKQPRYLTAHQVIELLQTLHYEAQRLVVHFIYDTGLRVSEVSRVRKTDLPDWRHYPNGQMYFPLIVKGSKGRGGKYKERQTIITKAYLFNFDFEENEKPGFLNVFGEPWTEDAIEALIRRARDRARFSEASAHRLRHGTAYTVLKSEHGHSMLDNLIILQKMLGHNDIDTTQINTHIPAPVLAQIRSNYGQAEFQARFEEAQEVFDRTYLPEKKEPPKHRIGATA